MFKFDFSAVHNAVVSLVDAANHRVPVEGLSKDLKVAGFDLGEDADVVIRAICAASTVVDLRAGRSGGVGRKEWFKGGANPEPTGVGAKIAKSIRETAGISLPKGDERSASLAIANAYLEALATGKCDPMPLAEVIKKFGKS
jgi:hypothetical protein